MADGLCRMEWGEVSTQHTSRKETLSVDGAMDILRKENPFVFFGGPSRVPSLPKFETMSGRRHRLYYKPFLRWDILIFFYEISVVTLRF